MKHLILFPSTFCILCFIGVTIFISGCSSLNCTRLEKFAGGDVNLIRLGNTISDTLVDNAMPPLIPGHPDEAILTSTFVNLDKLNETSRMGRLLQNQTGTRLVQRGYSVKEVTLRNTMKINPQDGETMLSRDLSQISPDNSVQAVLVGTYLLNNRILYITAKLVNPVNRNILSAQSYRICMDDNLLSMFGLQRKRNQANDFEAPSKSIIDEIFY